MLSELPVTWGGAKLPWVLGLSYLLPKALQSLTPKRRGRPPKSEALC